MIVHCLFEQSGTFKNAFRRLDITAYDYDIENQYNETDYIIDIFTHIEDCMAGNPSLFDNIQPDDLTLAFFPCIYFCENNQLFFSGQSNIFKGKPQSEILKRIIARSQMRQTFYLKCLQLVYIAETRGIRLIIENPYSVNGYLYNNFPYKPAFVDFSRNIHGDKFSKPTAYWFINCAPLHCFETIQPRATVKINSLTGHRGEGKCSLKRSEITPDYADNFIADYITGNMQRHKLVQLKCF